MTTLVSPLGGRRNPARIARPDRVWALAALVTAAGLLALGLAIANADGGAPAAEMPVYTDWHGNVASSTSLR